MLSQTATLVHHEPTGTDSDGNSTFAAKEA